MVVGGPQVQTLAATLNYFSTDVQFDHILTHPLPPAKAKGHIARRVRENKDAEYVLTFNLGPRHDALASDQIRMTFPGREILRINDLSFTGYHPDLLSVGPAGAGFDGPLGEHHSRIAMYAFAEGLSCDATVAMYNDAVYRALGYYGDWRRSTRRMIDSDADVDLPFGAQFTSMLKDQLGLYTSSQPTPRIFAAWARAIVNGLAARGLVMPREWDPDESSLPHLLTESATFPVYPEIVAHHRLPFAGSYVFKADGYSANSFLSLADFVEGEFEAFERVGAEGLRKTASWPRIAARFTALRK